MNILHKLGLYKKSEIDELIESTVNLLGSVDGVIEGAKLDRQCYKAAMSALREVNTVEHAVKVISEYCAKGNCADCDYNVPVYACEVGYACPYYLKDKGECKDKRECKYKTSKKCRFANNPPCDWEV